jgi:peptide/nickel transport system ATP-binding protein
LLITHNMGVLNYLADYVAVMYMGKIVEYGPVDQVLNHPQHPYTKTLLAAVPKIKAESASRIRHCEGF